MPAKVYSADDLKAASGSTLNMLDDPEYGTLQVAADSGLYPHVRLGGIRLDETRPRLSPEETARIRRDAANQPLVLRLVSLDLDTSGAACLAALNDASVRPPDPELLAILRDSGAPSYGRQCSVNLLVAFGTNSALRESLLAALKDHDRQLRRIVVEAITLRFSDPQVVMALAAALKDPFYMVRGNAAVVLARLGPKAASAVPALVEALDAEWPQERPGYVGAVRMRVVGALEQMGPAARAALPALERASKRKQSGHDVPGAARRALQAIQGGTGHD